MFKIVANPTFTHTVRVSVPVNGGHQDETIKVTYRVLGTDQVDKFDLATAEGTAEFLHAAIERIEDIADEAGNPMQYNDQVRDQLLRLPFVRIAVSRGYFDGVAKARPGN